VPDPFSSEVVKLGYADVVQASASDGEMSFANKVVIRVLLEQRVGAPAGEEFGDRLVDGLNHTAITRGAVKGARAGEERTVIAGRRVCQVWSTLDFD
jgi:hypothetical protein